MYFCEDCTGSMFKCPNSSPGFPLPSLARLSLTLCGEFSTPLRNKIEFLDLS